MNTWTLNEVEQQFIAIDRETALVRYKELLELDAEETGTFNDEAYARFSLKLISSKYEDGRHE